MYTGTHDNDTTVGWHAALGEAGLRELRRYIPAAENDVAWDLIRTAWASVADLAVVPVQDLLSLGTAARMNFPGTGEGNWRWRLADGQWTSQVMERLRELTEVYGRAPKAHPP